MGSVYIREEVQANFREPINKEDEKILITYTQAVTICHLRSVIYNEPKEYKALHIREEFGKSSEKI